MNCNSNKYCKIVSSFFADLLHSRSLSLRLVLVSAFLNRFLCKNATNLAGRGEQRS